MREIDGMTTVGPSFDACTTPVADGRPESARDLNQLGALEESHGEKPSQRWQFSGFA